MTKTQNTETQVDDGFERVNVDIKKIEVGESFIGIYQEASKRDWFDAKKLNPDGSKGAMVTIDQYHFTDTQGKNPFVVFADAGMKNTFVTANIKKGDTVKVIRREKSDIGGGQSVNNYDLFKKK